MSMSSIFLVTYFTKTSNGHFPRDSGTSSPTVCILAGASSFIAFGILELDPPDRCSGNALESHSGGARFESPDFQEPDRFYLFMFFFSFSLSVWLYSPLLGIASLSVS
jgi:hypothetical protein